MKHEEDRDLEAAFDDLRRHAREHTPAYQRVRARAWDQPIRSRRRSLALAACTGLVALALVWGYRAEQQAPSPAELDLARMTSWRAPTDFLLRTPRSRVLIHVPSLEFSLEPNPC